MKLTKDIILEKLESLSASEALPVARSFLNSLDVVQFAPLIAGKPTDERVVCPKDIFRTWEVRYNNALKKGSELPGCAEFVRKLKSIPDSTELINVAFKKDEVIGLFWFDRSSGEPIGFVIAARADVS